MIILVLNDSKKNIKTAKVQTSNVRKILKKPLQRGSILMLLQVINQQFYER